MDTHILFAPDFLVFGQNQHESASIYACLRFASDSLDLDLGQLIWSSVLLVE